MDFEEEKKKNPELNQDVIDHIKQWLAKQPHLPTISGNFEYLQHKSFRWSFSLNNYCKFWEVHVANPPFSDLGFENGLNRLYMIVCLFSFVHLLLFFLSQGSWGHAIPPFLILDSKMDWIGCIPISFVHDCIPLFSFVHLLLFFLWGGGWGTCYPSFSDFGFQNGLDRLYFVCTWLYWKLDTRDHRRR